MLEYSYCLDQEITVHYPPTPRNPRGRVRDGVIVRRQNISRCGGWIHRYTVLFDDEQADTFIPSAWIKPRAQAALSV